MSRIAAPQAPAQIGPAPAGAADTERMFPLDESQRPGQRPTAGERRALAVCRRCPVLESGREAVLGMQLPYGVTGGLTAAQRRGVRAERTRAERAEGAGPWRERGAAAPRSGHRAVGVPAAGVGAERAADLALRARPGGSGDPPADAGGRARPGRGVAGRAGGVAAPPPRGAGASVGSRRAGRQAGADTGAAGGGRPGAGRPPVVPRLLAGRRLLPADLGRGVRGLRVPGARPARRARRRVGRERVDGV